MATSISIDGLAHLAAALGDLGPILGAIGVKAKAVIEEEGKADTGGDLILSHFARGRVQMAVKVESSGTTVSLTATPTGPWMLIEAGSHKAGWWEPRKGKGGIKFGDGNVRRYVRHGPVRAKRTFSRARERVADEAPKWFQDEIHKLIAKG